MTDLSIEDFYQIVGRRRESALQWRAGQCWLNALWEVRPDLARRVHGTGLDPFYDSSRLKALNAWLKLHWDNDVLDYRN